MSEITIQCRQPVLLKSIISTALEREKKILHDAIKRTQIKLEHLQFLQKVDKPEKLLNGDIDRNEFNEMDLLEMEGEVEVMKHLKNKLQSIEEMQIHEYR